MPNAGEAFEQLFHCGSAQPFSSERVGDKKFRDRPIEGRGTLRPLEYKRKSRKIFSAVNKKGKSFGVGKIRIDVRIVKKPVLAERNQIVLRKFVRVLFH